MVAVFLTRTCGQVCACVNIPVPVGWKCGNPAVTCVHGKMALMQVGTLTVLRLLESQEKILQQHVENQTFLQSIQYLIIPVNSELQYLCLIWGSKPTFYSLIWVSVHSYIKVRA